MKATTNEDPAERAFDHLRAEVTVMRRAVEELRTAVEDGEAPDYSEALAQIVNGNAVIAKHIERLAQHTGARLPPDQYAQQMAQAADNAFRPMREVLETAQRTLVHAAQRFDAAQQMARTRTQHREQIWAALAIGACGGMLLLALVLLPLVRLLPDSWAVPERLAAGVVGLEPWAAGQRLMASANPPGFAYVQEGWRLRDAGGDKLADCLAQVEKSGKPKRCTVTLTPRRSSPP